METMEDWINSLKRESCIILVEGKKDKKNLASFGIRNIITLEGKPLFKTIEEISEKNKLCIILTDLDKEGKKLYHALKHNLQKKGVKINDTYRNFLFKKTKFTQIEGIKV